ncbi:hypothetical protein [Mucilaginibacter humi]|uniref:hypothetical protein n=1 Tax=Mucilaginibacter humi TaxID=2732510 RepID=UPI00293BF200|nr:hypothetical protein [Mucilaginibacter humi]
MLAIFCFAAYTFTAVGDSNGDLLAVVGFAILVISIVMGFPVHFKTGVENKSIILNGLWTSRPVKIDLNSIVKAEVAPYSKYRLTTRFITCTAKAPSVFLRPAGMRYILPIEMAWFTL